MYWKTFVAPLAACVVALAAAAQAQAPGQTPAQSSTQTPAQTPDLAVGQEWSIKGEPGAKAIIGWIDPRPDGKSDVSVSLIDIPSEHGSINIGHAPFARDALVSSLDKLIATGVRPPIAFQKGFDAWKSGDGQVFKVTVSEAIAGLQGQLKGHEPER